MKTIIFSDTHLTRRFSIRKFIFLVDLLKNADRVIINGDFWDNSFTDFDGFINSKWKMLFPILKSKHAIYIYGNHDPKAASDSRVNDFSEKQSHEHRFSQNGISFFVTHGHTIRAGMERFNTLRIAKYLRKPIHLAGDIFEWALIRVASSIGKKLFLHRHIDNRFLKLYADSMDTNNILVCGHAHLAFFMPGHRYINLGSIRFGHASYLLIDDDGIHLEYQRY